MDEKKRNKYEALMSEGKEGGRWEPIPYWCNYSKNHIFFCVFLHEGTRTKYTIVPKIIIRNRKMYDISNSVLKKG